MRRRDDRRCRPARANPRPGRDGPRAIIAGLFPASPRTSAMTQTMKALVKREAGKGIWMEQVPVPAPGPERSADQAREDRDLRHRPAHLHVGRVEPAHDQAGPGDRPRVRRPHRRTRRRRHRLQARRARVGRRPHRLRPLPQLPRRPPAPVPEHRRHRRQPQRRVRRIHRDAGQQPVADPGPDPERAGRVLRSRTATPRTARWSSTWSARTC